MTDVTVFGRSANGTRMAQVDLPRLRVQVTPLTEEHNQAAAEAAQVIAEKLALVDDLRERLVRANAEMASLHSRLESALSGKRRLFGRVLLAPVKDWSGEVWLMDPEKRERGFALRFGSLAECRRAFPELWPVGVQGDGVLLDAWGTP